jgi:hypothetical protein
VIRLRQRHSAVPLLRSLGHFLGNIIYKYSAATRLGKTDNATPRYPSQREKGEKRSHLLRSMILLISAFAWFIASSAVSSPLFAFDK